MNEPQFLFQEAKWWKGPLEIDGGTIRPIRSQLEPYNVFDSYFPAGSGARKAGSRSLYFEFINLDATDQDKIADFCTKYGVPFGYGWKDWERLSTEGVFPGVYGQLNKTPRDKTEAEGIRYWENVFHDHFGGMTPDSQIIMDTTFREFKAAQREFRAVVAWERETRQGPEIKRLSYPDEQRFRRTGASTEQELGRFLIEDRLRLHLSQIRQISTWDDQVGRWRFGCDASSLLSLMYLMFALDLQRDGRILVCPWCHNTFLGEKSKTIYCQPRCQNSAKVKRSRDKKAQLEAGREGEKSHETKSTRQKRKRPH